MQASQIAEVSTYPSSSSTLEARYRSVQNLLVELTCQLAAADSGGLALWSDSVCRNAEELSRMCRELSMVLARSEYRHASSAGRWKMRQQLALLRSLLRRLWRVYSLRQRLLKLSGAAIDAASSAGDCY